jgi:hypothetical protein
MQTPGKKKCGKSNRSRNTPDDSVPDNGTRVVLFLAMPNAHVQSRCRLYWRTHVFIGGSADDRLRLLSHVSVGANDSAPAWLSLVVVLLLRGRSTYL